MPKATKPSKVQTTTTLVQEDGKVWLREEMLDYVQPRIAVRYFEISFDRSVRPLDLLGKPLSDGYYTAIYRISDPLDSDWYRLNGCCVVLAQGENTKPSRVEFRFVPCPKVGKGMATRWHKGAWQKETKRGWVDA